MCSHDLRVGFIELRAIEGHLDPARIGQIVIGKRHAPRDLRGEDPLDAGGDDVDVPQVHHDLDERALVSIMGVQAIPNFGNGIGVEIIQGSADGSIHIRSTFSSVSSGITAWSDR